MIIGCAWSQFNTSFEENTYPKTPDNSNLDGFKMIKTVQYLLYSL
ncbi:hypothetical protein J537_0526 [Acinetobacter baumannii 1437282]|nr:hypothetical protein J537_0526 [Acinetobacter baumannii 1437282]